MRRAAGIVAVLVGAVVWLKIATLLAANLLATTAWSSGDFGVGEGFARALSVANVVEPHIASFNTGTLLAAHGRLAEARAPLEEALETTPPADECAVRLNLALVLEGLAAEADPTDDTAPLLADARAVASAATPACRESLLAAVVERLETAAAEPAPPELAPRVAPQPAPFDEVARRMAEGAHSQAERESNRAPVAPTVVERPW